MLPLLILTISMLSSISADPKARPKPQDPNEYYYAEYGEEYDNLYYNNQDYDYGDTYNYEDASDGKFMHVQTCP